MDTNEIIKCKICSSDAAKAFEHIVLKKHNVAYYKCQKCGFLFTEEPYWLDSAYDKAISSADTGVMRRNLKMMIDVYSFLMLFKLNKSEILDYGGGYGILCRLLRDLGINCKWYDAYSQNLISRGFEGDLNKKFSCSLLFEVMEHIPNPSVEVENIFNISKTLICSTDLMQEDIPNYNWEYYSFPTGQHISFYAKNTMEYIAKKHKRYYYHLWGLHIFVTNKIPKHKLWAMKLLNLSRGFRVIYFLIQSVINHKSSLLSYDNSTILKEIN